jgi:hypothetical protein
MRNGRFHPSNSRGKVQKMGVVYTHSPKTPCPSPNFLIIPQKRIFKTKKIRKGGAAGGLAHSLSSCGLQPVGDQGLPTRAGLRPAVGRRAYEGALNSPY